MFSMTLGWQQQKQPPSRDAQQQGQPTSPRKAYIGNPARMACNLVKSSCFAALELAGLMLSHESSE